jgi:plastocyanin
MQVGTKRSSGADAQRGWGMKTNNRGTVTAFMCIAILATALVMIGGSRLTAAATPGADMTNMTGDTSPREKSVHVANTLQSTTVVTVTVGGVPGRFTPDSVTIPTGATVRWVWTASNHTVTSGTPGHADGLFCSPDDQNCSTSLTSAAGFVYEHTFSVAGDYPYYCRIHGAFGMTGTVIVTDIANPTMLFLPIIVN